jgi:tRNA-splicing ligase RtcB
MFSNIPCGVGQRGKIVFNRAQERKIVEKGSSWLVEQGYGRSEDLIFTESGGALRDADPDAISNRAYERGKGQCGTLGSGNHFMEVQVVDTIYDADTAGIFNLEEGQVTVMIHCGSRGLGHQVCDDSLKELQDAPRKYGISLPDRQLVCAPVTSQEGQRYLGAMRGAANFAWANRQVLLYLIRNIFEKFFGMTPKDLGMHMIYDVAHNIAKIEKHAVDGKPKMLCVHRKGATRAFPPRHPEIPEKYREIGQPVLIPGDMGRYSFLLLGSEKAMRETFGSTCHGAGRLMSRKEAIRRAQGRSIQAELAEKGIVAMARGRHGLDEEQPDAYKDVNVVVDVVHNAGISKKVCRMRPLGVIKG